MRRIFFMEKLHSAGMPIQNTRMLYAYRLTSRAPSTSHSKPHVSFCIFKLSPLVTPCVSFPPFSARPVLLSTPFPRQSSSSHPAQSPSIETMNVAFATPTVLRVNPSPNRSHRIPITKMSRAPRRPNPRPRPPKRPRKPTPSYSQSDYSRCMQLASRSDKRPARAAFKTAAEANPSDGRIWLAWAQMEARSGNSEAARAIFADGVDADPSNVRLLHAWAVCEDRAGRPDDARRLFRRCLDLQPFDGITWQSLALMEERRGNTDTARNLFEQGVKHDPRNAYLWSAWGVLEQRHGQYDQACERFEKAIGLDDQHVRTYQAWAITKERMGLHDESAQLFRQALQVNSRSVPTYQAYALFEARRGNLDKARELFQRGIDIDNSHAPIWHAWAVMEQKDERYDVARELFERGVDAAPYNTPMLRAWAKMELELGHIDTSRDWMVPQSSYRKKPKQRGGRNSKRQISTVGENLKMLRLLIEQRSDEDVKSVMKWLDGRARTDRELYDALQERGGSDVRKVSSWVQRRSESDVKSFKEWFGERYERDRRIGVYIFNWDIPPRTPSLVPVKVEERKVEDEEKPVEWFRLSEKPSMALQTFDEQLYSSDNPTDYANGIYFMGQIAENLADRAALLFCLGAMSLGLIGASVHLFDQGYSPSGETTQGAKSPTTTPPPSGVDAYLYEEDGVESVTRSSSRKAQVP